MSSHHDEVLPGEAERGERVAVRAYQEALQGMLPPTVSDLVERQHAAVRDAHARVIALEVARQVGMQVRMRSAFSAFSAVWGESC